MNVTAALPIARPVQPPLLGILGGMGPLATIDFLNKLTHCLPVSRDQDHLPWIALSQPGAPDRSRAVENGDDGPLPYLIQGATYLAAQGVQLIAIPCSTSHCWFDRVQQASPVPILHIAEAASEALHLHAAFGGGTIAVLATRGTIKNRIYETRLEAAGFQAMSLQEADQRAVDAVIRNVKAGHLDDARGDLQSLQAALQQRGAAGLILGCTELPLVYECGLPAIDVTQSLAEAALRRLGYLAGDGMVDGEQTASGPASIVSL